MIKKIKLHSSNMISAPNIVRWAIEHYKSEPKKMLKVPSEGWGFEDDGPSVDDFNKLLTGKVPYTVESSEFGGTVVFYINDLSSAQVYQLYEAAEALIDVLDGVQGHDIQGNTGLSEERCAEIHQIRLNTIKLLETFDA